MVLTDAQWERWNRIALARRWMLAGSGGDTRLFLEAVLWTARTGSSKSGHRQIKRRLDDKNPRPDRRAGHSRVL